MLGQTWVRFPLRLWAVNATTTGKRKGPRKFTVYLQHDAQEHIKQICL
jgi:hypothetical protein